LASKLTLNNSKITNNGGSELFLYQAHINHADTVFIGRDGQDVNGKIEARDILVTAPKWAQLGGGASLTLCESTLKNGEDGGVALELQDTASLNIDRAMLSPKHRLAELNGESSFELSESQVIDGDESRAEPIRLPMIMARGESRLTVRDVIVNSNEQYSRMISASAAAELDLDTVALNGLTEAGVILKAEPDTQRYQAKSLRNVSLNFEDGSEVKPAIFITQDYDKLDEVTLGPISSNGAIVVNTTDNLELVDELSGLIDEPSCHAGLYSLNCSAESELELCTPPMEDQ
jgi:hypothetical protein